MHKIFLILILTSSLFSEYIKKIEILTSETDLYKKKLPIRFITDGEIEIRANLKGFSIFSEPIYQEIESETIQSFEIGIAFLNNLFLEVSDTFSEVTVNRKIEFYSENFISPYFRVNFRDIELMEKQHIFMRNSLEINYVNFNKQTPFFPDTGTYPYNRSYNIGTEIDSLSLFWKGSFLYKASFFSGGGYIGTGLNILDGSASYLRYVPSDMNSSLASNIASFGDGRILEKGESINLNTTSSLLFKYGVTLNIDFKPIHFGFGIDFGITSESNLYWIKRSYFMELSYLF